MRSRFMAHSKGCLVGLTFDFPDKEGEHMDESLLRKTG